MAERIYCTIVSDSAMISLLFVFCVSLNFEAMFMNLKVWHWACCSRKNFITDFASKCLASRFKIHIKDLLFKNISLGLQPQIPILMLHCVCTPPFQFSGSAPAIPVVEITSGHRSISERFFKLTAHYSMWSVRMTDHACMVAQQLCTKADIKWRIGLGTRLEGTLDERLGLSSSVSCYWVQLFYTILVSRGSLTDC